MGARLFLCAVTPLRKGMSSEFWEAIEAGSDAGIEVMGKMVKIGGRDVMAVPQQGMEVNKVVTEGGRKTVVGLVLHVGVEDGKAVKDGDLVIYDDVRGRVDRKENIGCAWLVTVGPENRWDGDIGD